MSRKVNCPDCGEPCDVEREFHADSINCANCGLFCEIDYGTNEETKEL
jgi:transcription elongation factor Elf1